MLISISAAGWHRQLFFYQPHHRRDVKAGWEWLTKQGPGRVLRQSLLEKHRGAVTSRDCWGKAFSQGILFSK